MNFLLQSNITRFGTVFFLVFILSILISLYRYILKLSAFYESRGDALMLTFLFRNVDADRFEKLVGSMMAENIDFKQPSTPIQQLVQLKKAFDK